MADDVLGKAQAEDIRRMPLISKKGKEGVMQNLIFLVLTLLAIGTGVWYAAFYQSPTPGATYASTYVYLSIGAAIIFAGLLTAGFVNRRESNSSVLFK